MPSPVSNVASFLGPHGVDRYAEYYGDLMGRRLLLQEQVEWREQLEAFQHRQRVQALGDTLSGMGIVSAGSEDRGSEGHS